MLQTALSFSSSSFESSVMIKQTSISLEDIYMVTNISMRASLITHSSSTLLLQFGHEQQTD